MHKLEGCPKGDLGDAYAEVAAYQASLVLGFPRIPPTVIRKVNGTLGSLQLFIETSIDALAPGVFNATLKEVDPEEVDNLKIFYFVFNQWDSGPHNILIIENQGKKHFVAIDNSGIGNHGHVKYGELPFVRVCYSEDLNTDDWNMPFPFEKAQVIAEPNADGLRTEEIHSFAYGGC